MEEAMQQEERRGLICYLVDEMRESGSWVGETHIQKCVYFLQNMMGIPTDYGFVLYKHGPYSFDLQGELAVLTSSHRLEWELHVKKYRPSCKWGMLGENQASFRLRRYDDAVKFVAQEISTKDVRALERLSTAFLIQFENPDLEEEQIVQNLRDIKPHISSDSAEGAVGEVREIERKAKRIVILKT